MAKVQTLLGRINSGGLEAVIVGVRLRHTDPEWFKPIRRSAALRMPPCMAVAARGRWLQRARSDPAGAHGSTIGIEFKGALEPVMGVAVRGFLHLGQNSER